MRNTWLPAPIGRSLSATAAVMIAAALYLPAAAQEAPQLGLKVYQQHCASCHGETGQGVRGEYSKALEGDRSIAQLTRYIAESMPEEEPELVVGDDAAAVAKYIYDAFYSPIARVRNRPPRVAVSRLTVRQYHNAMADLIGSFRSTPEWGDQRGLSARYYKSRQMRDNDQVFERVDDAVAFDFGPGYADRDKFDPKGFSVRWDGSVIAPETGEYEFIVRSDQAIKLWVNDPANELIDAWVKSGDDTEFRASIHLLAGRAYQLRMEFSSYRQGVSNSDEREGEIEPEDAFIELWWKRPGHTETVIPRRNLVPQRVDEVYVVTAPLPPDDRSEGYDRGASVSRAWDEATTDAAIEAAIYVSEHIDELARIRRNDETSEREGKIRRFCSRFVERAFRRPLDDDVRQRYLDAQFDDAPDLDTAIKRVVLLTLKSPRFLYVGIGREPDDYEIASRLSFTLWDSLPDDELLRAAAAGELSDRAAVAAHAGRMVDDERAISKAMHILHRWLKVEDMHDLAKDDADYPGFDKEIASELRTSLDLMLEDVLRSDAADFRELLLTDEVYLNGRLAQFYGLGLPAESPFKRVKADRPERVGIVSHPFLLSGFAYTDTTSPIHRGVFLSRNVLGRALRPPPEAVAPFAAELHPDLTTRQRVERQTAPANCASCHEMINSLGFALEEFDAVGRFRRIEKDKPIDASGAYELPDGSVQTFNGAEELAHFLASSREAQRAFVVQMFHHSVKQPIYAYGQQTPDELRDAFESDGFNIRELMAEIAIRAAMHRQESAAESPRDDDEEPAPREPAADPEPAPSPKPRLGIPVVRAGDCREALAFSDGSTRISLTGGPRGSAAIPEVNS